MRYISSIFTKKSNKLNKSDGAIFRGRYKAILIDTDNYLLEVNRYIHLNPVLAKMVLKPEDYQWSSYSYYISQTNIPSWLLCKEILCYFESENRIKSYQKFILSNLGSKITQFYDDQGKIPDYDIIPILGDIDFLENVKKQYINDSLEKNIPQKIRLTKLFFTAVEEIIGFVSKYYNVEMNEIKNNRCKRLGNLPRKVAIYIACDSSGKTHKEIATSFIGISPSSISKMYYRVKIETKDNISLSNDIETIRMNMSNARI